MTKSQMKSTTQKERFHLLCQVEKIEWVQGQSITNFKPRRLIRSIIERNQSAAGAISRIGITEKQIETTVDGHQGSWSNLCFH